MYSANHDVECVFIDGTLKHANVDLESMPRFVERLNKISSQCGIDFYVSISASKDDLKEVDFNDCSLLN
ncbi:MAG: hypothetical protein V8S08_08245 [Lachnoclostridium sp.]